MFDLLFSEGVIVWDGDSPIFPDEMEDEIDLES